MGPDLFLKSDLETIPTIVFYLSIAPRQTMFGIQLQIEENKT